VKLTAVHRMVLRLRKELLELYLFHVCLRGMFRDTHGLHYNQRMICGWAHCRLNSLYLLFTVVQANTFTTLFYIYTKYQEFFILMFIPCIIRRTSIRNNQQYALICTTPLFCVLVPTYFGSSLPSSGSFVDPSEFLEIQIPAGEHNRRNHDNPTHRSRNHTLYDIPPIRFVFQVTQEDLRNSLMMAGYCRNM
jgi:hypothetical protein